MALSQEIIDEFNRAFKKARVAGEPPHGVGQAADRFSLFVAARVAFAGHHHADGRFRVPLERIEFLQTAVDRRLEHVDVDARGSAPWVGTTAEGDRLGLNHVEAGPLVRSSYHARESLESALT